ncbi:FAD-dependent monooxygenase [Gandjariella thermophila]|uniref:Salicylate hydroxylase n=1 Tax=Gandjariella thermophila TaxID=1931992 RepID=A0A4D4J7Z0_9PSEU|nr:FAD-dependent monooxygenase [Gandjariella thermophila]GDY32761.1 salicylate hydroxylase [Gandjariella thermophila]
MNADELRVAVVGAGIAGLTVAAALSRADVTCEVYEQTAHLREIGAGIQVSPNGSRLLHRLGLGHLLDRVAVRPSAIEVRRWCDDTVVARTILGDACVELYDAPYYCVHRADLHHSLLESLPLGMVHLGRRCVAVTEYDDRVELEFADGSRTAVDVLIGADGIRSTIRRSMVDDAPRFSGHCVYRGLVPVERVAGLFDEHRVVIWMGPEQHCVAYPIRGGTAVSFAASAPAGEWREESWSQRGRREDVLAAYAGWSRDLLALLSTPDSPSRWALYDREPVKQWSTDRVALVGDAAHPMLPFGAQGAAMGMEDAVVLAGCLAGATPGGVPDALVRYEELRRPRVERVHQFIRANEKSHHVSGEDEQRRRDEELRGDFGLRARAWLFGYDAGSVAA